MQPYNIENEIQNIKVPTFVCMAWKDGTMTIKMFEKLKNTIPNATSHLYKQYKHNITIEARDDLPQRIMNFFYK
jgi:esterase/lipase